MWIKQKKQQLDSYIIRSDFHRLQGVLFIGGLAASAGVIFLVVVFPHYAGCLSVIGPALIPLSWSAIGYLHIRKKEIPIVIRVLGKPAVSFGYIVLVGSLILTALVAIKMIEIVLRSGPNG